MTNDLHCIGCGLAIQTQNPTDLGYTPKSAYEKGIETGELYCRRCFQLRHYNKIEKVSISDDAFLNMLHTISDKRALVVNVIDIFDVYGSIISGLQRFVGRNDILVVANKIDLLPGSTNLRKVKHWLTQQLHQQGIKPIDIVLVSSKKKKAIDELLDKIEKYRNHRDTYVVGVTNVGKSTLINSIIASLGGAKELITTSRFPGTTLDQIKIPFEDDTYLIDTPGIIHSHQMAHFVQDEDLKVISPQTTLKPVTFQLNEKQTVFLAGLGRFDYISGGRNSITCYFAKSLLLHRTKQESANAFYEKHNGTLLVPSTKEKIQLHKREFDVDANTDIVYSGLGWITVNKKGKVIAYAPKGVDITIRQSII